MTIPGIDMIVALAIVAAIGDAGRFETAEKLVTHVALTQASGNWVSGPAHHGRITKQGRGHARDAGRGCLGGGAGARTASRLLFARALQARPACRCCRNRKENGGPHLASLVKVKATLGQGLLFTRKNFATPN